MALSTKDAAAVKAAAIAGLGNTAAGVAAGNTAVAAGNAAPSGAYGTDAKTGQAIGPANDPLTKAAPASPVTDPAKLSTPGTPINSQQTGANAFQSASTNLGSATQPGAGGNASETNLLPITPPNKYQKGLATLKGGGVAAPSQAGDARSAISGAVPQAPDTSGVDNFMSKDPAINTLMSGIAQLLNPQMQTTTLMDDYQKLYKESGLGDINKQIIDADTVINGTEQDIRNEIQTAGGFGTDSQVQAMSLARNKSLLTRYNQLVQMKTDASNQLNTMMSLNSQDKQMAQTRVNNQINAMFQMADFRQKAMNNVQEQYKWLAQTMGVDGLYNAYKQDPRQMAMLEQVLGVAPGGMKGLADQSAKDRARKTQMENLDMEAKRASINASNRSNRDKFQYVPGTANQPGGTFDPYTGKFTPSPTTKTGGGQLALSKQQSDIMQTQDLLKNPGLSSAVGPTGLSRGTIFGVPWSYNNFSGAKTNFIASVKQIQDQLTLQNLQNAKQNGATFGALSDSELSLLSASASKLGSWEIKKDGNVLGYNASEKDFKAEMNKINNFSKLDYILKGGDPTSVGVKEMPDGTLWTQDGDGNMTEIR